nr:hypothetical protein [Candidatus Njordarchaeum guaymaensis]
MRRTSFDKEYLSKEFDKLSSKLSASVSLFIIGGGGLIFYGLKDATKDIDIVLQHPHEPQVLVDALKSLGYFPPSSAEISTPYRKMGALEILENKDGLRWDVFDRQVCNALTFSNAMKYRAVELYVQGPLEVLLASKEDIFLFKGITERETDLDDMRFLAESGLDWNVVEQECRNQSTTTGRLWENALYERLVDLRNKHKIESPIEKSLRATLEVKLIEITLMEEIKQGNNTVRLISQAINEPQYFVRESLKKLERKGLIEVDKSQRPYKFVLSS